MPYLMNVIELSSLHKVFHKEILLEWILVVKSWRQFSNLWIFVFRCIFLLSLTLLDLFQIGWFLMNVRPETKLFDVLQSFLSLTFIGSFIILSDCFSHFYHLGHFWRGVPVVRISLYNIFKFLILFDLSLSFQYSNGF